MCMQVLEHGFKLEEEEVHKGSSKFFSGLYIYFRFTDKLSNANKPDPVREICDIPVKIADLGNACWTVSTSCSSLHLFLIWLIYEWGI